MVMEHRFKSNVLDECIHIMLAVLAADIYDMQRLDMIDSYGADIVDKAYLVVSNDYATILSRLK